MDEAKRLTDVLLKQAPAAGRCLSPLGQRSAFPKGIPWQTSQARDTEINATIGQVTDGAGDPLPLSAMDDALSGLDRRMAFLYSPAEGWPALRKAWAEHQRQGSLGSSAKLSLPMTVHGLTQAVSLVADTFADPDTDVIIPDPCWENYHLVFQHRPGANIISWLFYKDGKLNIDGFAAAVGQITRKKSVVCLSFPANPSGYHPTPAEMRQIVDVLVAHPGPMVVLCDDAYAGMVWEDGLAARSPYWDLAERADPERLFPIKADGATKELVFFGGRIAFVGGPVSGEAEDALISKWKCIIRSQNGVTNGPAQALVLKALRDPAVQADVDARKAILVERYRALKAALQAHPSDVLTPLPFNSGVFAMLEVRKDVDCEDLRQRLIRDEKVGVISLPSVNAIRVAYCSVKTSAIDELVKRIVRAAGSGVRT